MTTASKNLEIINEKKMFDDLLPEVIMTLQNKSKLSEVPQIGDWLKKMLHYNLVGGKHTRGITTVISYKTIEKPEKVTEHTLKMACKLGWCVEMFQAYCIVLDDIMDGSSVRRGMPCWYRRPEVGITCAFNDSLLIHSSLFEFLKTNFRTNPNYMKMFELFNETLWRTSMGQHLDHVTGNRKTDYSSFTLDRYYTIIKYKAAYYTYNLPVSLGLLLAENVDEKIYKSAQDICLEIGTMFQIQDDFIDCFGDEIKTGKVGTDIQERKCTWLAVQALQRCTEAQRTVFKACYGSSEPAHVERIKRLYEDLHLPQIYKHQEKAMYDNIIRQIENIPIEAARVLFKKLLDITYNRQH
ncbi:farnesyl diphosphate synthase 2 isoform X1 [Bombyx mori]